LSSILYRCRRNSSFAATRKCPAGVSTGTPGYVPHPGCPPGLGAPQWELSGYPQTGLKLIASVPPGQRFTYQAARLPPRR
jgi:hypothetical protein